MIRITAVCLLLALAGCIAGSRLQLPERRGNPKGPESLIEWPKDWSKHVGQTVTLEGTSFNAKEGAILDGGNGMIWIDGVNSWSWDKRVRVTGKVIERGDVPVFIDEPGAFMQGIPVPPGTDLKKAARRYLLTDAKWIELPAKETTKD